MWRVAPAAANFYGDPTATLVTAGVTGTNGKTTSAFLLRALLQAGGRQTGLLGTVKSVIGGVEREVLRTTPEAIDLQSSFREMLEQKPKFSKEVTGRATDPQEMGYLAENGDAYKAFDEP